MSERGHRHALRDRVRDPELRRYLSLRLSSIRANPDALWLELCRTYAQGHGDGWDDHERDVAITTPPPPEER